MGRKKEKKDRRKEEGRKEENVWPKESPLHFSFPIDEL